MSCFTFVKLMMTLFDLLILLCGATMLAVGLWVSMGGHSFLHYLGPFSTRAIELINIGYFSMAVGCMMILLGLVGFCAARKESKCQLLGFFSIILIIFTTEVAAAVVALSYSSFAEKILKEWVIPTLQEKYGGDTLITAVWNSTMTEMSCCGFSNYTDFLGSKFEEENGGDLPPSCCWANTAPCSLKEAQLQTVEGCSGKILKSVRDHANIVGAIAAGVGGVEVGAMILATYLYFYLDNKEE